MNRVSRFLSKRFICFTLGLSIFTGSLSNCFAETHFNKINSFLEKVCEEEPKSDKQKEFIKHCINERFRISREHNYAPKSSSEGYIFGKKLEMDKTFEKIYDSNFWGSKESKSGPDSQLKNTENIRKKLPEIFEKYNIKSVLDVPCGDYNWMKNVKKDGIKYIGGDIVPKIIAENNKKYKDDNTQFRKLDITKDKLPKSDMIICRDCFQHLSDENVKKAIENFKNSGSTYLLVTNYPWTLENWDIKDGDFRPLNLCEEPFNFSESCLEKIKESSEQESYSDKNLCLYKLEDIDINKMIRSKKAVKEISIAMAFDENYVYPTLISMTSIMENSNPNINYDFYLMHTPNLSKKGKNVFKSFQKRYNKNCKVNLIDMKDAYKSARTNCRIPTPAYYRLMLSELLPNKDKIIWMDSDTLIFDDLSEMYSIDVEGYYYRGLLDYDWTPDLFKNFGIIDDHYICDGVMLANLKELRKDNMVKKFGDFISKNNNKLTQHDQTVINAMCLEKIGILPAKFGIFPSCSSGKYFKCLKSPEKYTQREIKNAVSYPSVLHCVNKYWKRINKHTHLWWKYAKKTDCFKEIKEKYLIPDGTYVISPSFNKNKAIDVCKASRAKGAKIRLWNKSNTNAQKFKVTYDKDGYYTITALCSGHKLSVPENSKESGTQLCQNSLKNSLCDKWHILNLGRGKYSIVSAYNGLNIDICRAESRNGTSVQCWSSNGTDAQKFNFVKSNK